MEVNDAVSCAFQHARSLFAEQPLSNSRLEEVEFSESAKEWLVTLGFDTGKKTRRSAGLMEDKYEDERIYKVFYIDDESGRLKKMKMR